MKLVCGLLRCGLGLVYGLLRFGGKIIWIYVGLVRDVCGLCRVGFGWFVVCPFFLTYLRLAYGFFNGGLECA